MPSKGGRREGAGQVRPTHAVVEAALTDVGGQAPSGSTPRASEPSDTPPTARRAGGTVVSGPGQTLPLEEPEPHPISDDPPGDTPEWVRLYSDAVDRRRRERERIEREQEEAQQLWEEFLQQQGDQVPEGERSLEHNEELHQRLMQLARTAAAAEY